MIRLSLTLPAALIAAILSGCAMHAQQMAQAPGGQTPIKRSLESHDLAVLNRLSWGVTPALAQAAESDGMSRIHHRSASSG